MIKEGKFGTLEAVWLIVTAISAKVFFSSPGTLIKNVGSAAWYVTIISAITALVGFLFIYLLLKRFPGKDLVEIFNLSLGRFFGFIFSGVLALYMLFISSTRLSEFSEVFNLRISPQPQLVYSRFFHNERIYFIRIGSGKYCTFF